MPARTPEDVSGLLVELFNAGDLDGIAALYEPKALMVAEPGRVISGQAQIRQAYEGFLPGKSQLAITPRQVLVLEGDVALASNNWQITGTNPDGSPMSASGTSAEILRRQPDGSWLYVVDDPFTQV
jgi:uncharacterized protein (TIGR02246 family)